MTAMPSGTSEPVRMHWATSSADCTDTPRRYHACKARDYPAHQQKGGKAAGRLSGWARPTTRASVAMGTHLHIHSGSHVQQGMEVGQAGVQRLPCGQQVLQIRCNHGVPKQPHKSLVTQEYAATSASCSDPGSTARHKAWCSADSPTVPTPAAPSLHPPGTTTTSVTPILGGPQPLQEEQRERTRRLGHSLAVLHGKRALLQDGCLACTGGPGCRCRHLHLYQQELHLKLLDVRGAQFGVLATQVAGEDRGDEGQDKTRQDRT